MAQFDRATALAYGFVRKIILSRWCGTEPFARILESRSMSRMVYCVKLGKEAPGLEKQPFPGELGERVYENISAEAYATWLPHMTLLINHYGLNPADPETRQLLRDQMTAFFFGVAEKPEGWAPEE